MENGQGGGSKASESSSACQPPEQRSMKIQTRALKCRQAILKGIRDIAQSGGGEDLER